MLSCCQYLCQTYRLDLKHLSYGKVNCCLSATAAVCCSGYGLFLTLGEKIEGGKMGHLLKFLEKYLLVGTEIRALEDHSGTDSNSQGLVPHNPPVVWDDAESL